jgi:hypothetical protein
VPDHVGVPLDPGVAVIVGAVKYCRVGRTMSSVSEFEVCQYTPFWAM